MKEINIKTNNREEFIDITELIREIISKENFDEGLVHIFVPHATSGITINENADPNLPKDINNFLNKLVNKGGWMHDKIDNNADSHIKASLIGSSVSVPVENGKLMLGTWQNIFLCEFDGPKNRKLFLNFIK
jgi:secondary thiamine-phosphate synthase enzyme